MTSTGTTRDVTVVLTSSTTFTTSATSTSITSDQMTITGSDSGDTDMVQFLHEQNMNRMSSLSPFLIYLGVLMVCGVVGNSLVLLVYYTKFKSSNPRTFVLTMSLCDLLTNVWALLTEMLEARFSYTFHHAWACKLLKTVMNVLVLFSGLVLVAVAMERQKMVCGQNTRAHSLNKIVRIALITTCCAFSVGVSLPRLALYGSSTYVFPGTNATGVKCNIQDSHKYSLFPVVYNGLLAMIFVVTVFTMIGCYGRIGVHLWRHKKRMVKTGRKEITSTSSDSRPHGNGRKKSETETSDMDTNASLDPKDVLVGHDSHSIQMVPIASQTSPTTAPRSLSPEPLSDSEVFHTPRGELEGREAKKPMKSKLSITSSEGIRIKPLARSLSRQTSNSSGKPLPSRTTLMLFVLTVFFIINFLPYLILEAMLSLTPVSSVWQMDGNLLLLGFRSYYLNSAINPLVYSFCSVKFRYECLQLAKDVRQWWARVTAIIMRLIIIQLTYSHLDLEAPASSDA